MPKSEERIDEFPEGYGTVRDFMLGIWVHFAKSHITTLGQEHGIIAKTTLAARRPDERAVDLAFEILDMAVGPGNRQHADEMRAPPVRQSGALCRKLLFDIAHGKGEILGRSCPAGRIDAGIAVERIDADA